MATCPNGHQNPEGPKFCGQCGAAIVATPPTCPSGHENPAGQKFCGACGAAIVATPPVTPTRQPPPTVPPPVTPTQPPLTTKGPSGKRKVWFVLAGLALLAAVLLVGSLVVGNGGLLLAAVAIVIIGVTIAVRSGQFGARTAVFFMAGLIAVVVLAFGARYLSFGLFGGRSSPSSPSSHSPSYQAGYTAGISGTAHNYLVETGTGINGPAVAADSACGVAFTAAQILTPDLNETDYQQGCHDALRDHPVTGGG